MIRDLKNFCNASAHVLAQAILFKIISLRPSYSASFILHHIKCIDFGENKKTRLWLPTKVILMDINTKAEVTHTSSVTYPVNSFRGNLKEFIYKKISQLDL